MTLVFDNPYIDPDSDMTLVIFSWIDKSTTIIFTLEAVCKIIAFGFAFCGPLSYIRSVANIFDFIIVLSAMFDLINKATNGGG